MPTTTASGSRRCWCSRRSRAAARRGDTGAKWDIYAERGIPSYWLIDPKARRLSVCELRDGVYVETGAVEGDDVLEVELPFPARISLARPRLAG